MECAEVREILDAYALGAADADEAVAIEEHVGDCVRCWSSLNEAQRTAAALALSTAFQRAPSSLRQRVIAEAERAERPGLLAGLMARLRRLWPLGAGALAAGAAAALAAAVFLQAEVSDLRDDRDRLQTQVQETGQQLDEQRQLLTVLAAPDVQQVRLQPADLSSPASGVYHWSRDVRRGALLCDNLPPLEEGEVYKVWFTTASGTYSVGDFQSWDGIGQVSVDTAALDEPPLAITMSIDEPGATEPGEMLLYAELAQ